MEDKRTTEPLTLSKWAKLKKKKNQLLILASRATVPNLFGTREQFHGRQSFHGGGGGGDDFRMLQAHYMYSAVYSEFNAGTDVTEGVCGLEAGDCCSRA